MEYRTPSIVIVSLAHVRLEPPPHLAFGLTGTSPPDRFYTFVSPTLVDVRARSCSLARSLVRSHRGTILHTGSSTTAERIDLFFFLPRRTYVVAAGSMRRALSMRGDTFCGGSRRKDEQEGRGKGSPPCSLGPVDICLPIGLWSILFPCLADTGNVVSVDTRYLLITV